MPLAAEVASVVLDVHSREKPKSAIFQTPWSQEYNTDVLDDGEYNVWGCTIGGFNISVNDIIFMDERQSCGSVLHDGPDLSGTIQRGDGNLRFMMSVNILLKIEIAQFHIDEEKVRTEQLSIAEYRYNVFALAFYAELLDRFKLVLNVSLVK